MDDIDELRKRNIQLETELRLAKEQLSQAQSGTQFLINCLSNQQAPKHPDQAGVSHAIAPSASAKSPQLSRRVEFTKRSAKRITWKLNSYGTKNASPTHSPPQDSFTQNDSSEEIDLLTFDDEDASPPPAAETSGGGDVAPHARIDLNDGAWGACRSPPPPAEGPVLIFNHAVMHREHNRLMGAAVFIEDMSEEEQTEHWKTLEKRDGRHTAQEWRMYYEEVVRPAYLAKTGGRDRDTDEDLEDGVEDNAAAQARIGTLEHIGESEHIPSDGGLAGSRWASKAPVVDKAPSPSMADGMAASQLVPDMPAKTWTSQKARANSRASAHPSPPSKHAQCAIPGTNDPRSLSPEYFRPDSDDEEYRDKIHDAETNASLMRDLDANEQTTSAARPDLDSNTGLRIGMGGNAINAMRNRSNSRPRGRSNGARNPQPPANALRVPRNEPDVLWRFNFQGDNLLHTVLISNIPTNLTLLDVLDAIRGDRILSATFANSAGMKTIPPIPRNAALVVFLSRKSTKEYIAYRARNPIYFWSTQAQAAVKASVSLVEKPSGAFRDTRTLEDIRQGLTRIFFIIDAEKRLTPEDVVADFVTCQMTLPIRAIRDKDGVLVFEFAEVRDADYAWMAVNQRTWIFGGVSKGFLPDPCDQPLGSLAANEVFGMEGGKVDMGVGGADLQEPIDDDEDDDEEDPEDLLCS